MSFISAARQNIRLLNTVGHRDNTNVATDIDKVGYLATVNLRFKGKVNCKHPSKTTFTKAPEAPWNLANRVKLLLNNSTSLWDVSGYGTYLQNVINKCDYKLDQIIAGSDVFKFGNAVSAAGVDNDIAFNLKINVSVNERDLVGLLLLQTNETVATVQIDCANAGVLMTDTDVTASLTGSWYITYEYFNVPASVEDRPVLNYLHQVIEDNHNIQSVGDNRFVLNRNCNYMRIINAVKLNGVPTLNNVDKATLRYNATNTPYSLPMEDFKALQLERYGRVLPDGVFVWDMFYQGMPNLGNQRDFILGTKLSEFDQILSLNSAAVLGNNNNTMRCVRDTLISKQ